MQLVNAVPAFKTNPNLNLINEMIFFVSFILFLKTDTWGAEGYTNPHAHTRGQHVCLFFTGLIPVHLVGVSLELSLRWEIPRLRQPVCGSKVFTNKVGKISIQSYIKYKVYFNGHEMLRYLESNSVKRTSWNVCLWVFSNHLRYSQNRLNLFCGFRSKRVAENNL